MPLTRVAVLGWPVSEARAEFAAAAAELGRVLEESGIAIARPGEPAEAIIALPGSTVTLADVLTECFDGPPPERPCGLLDTANYFSHLLTHTEDGLIERLVRESQRGRLILERDPAALVRALAEYRPPETRRG
ncbi:MAG: hypothetical protein ACT4PM_12255 [Gemmatimonadales bacterium]